MYSLRAVVNVGAVIKVKMIKTFAKNNLVMKMNFVTKTVTDVRKETLKKQINLYHTHHQLHGGYG